VVAIFIILLFMTTERLGQKIESDENEFAAQALPGGGRVSPELSGLVAMKFLKTVCVSAL
jgi:hypothetical protein